MEKTSGRQARSATGYFSRFGGLWTDRDDAPALISRELSAGRIGAADARLLRDWIRQGYVILPGAISPGTLEQFNREIDSIWRRGDDRLSATVHGYQKDVPMPLEPGFQHLSGVKLLDLYFYSKKARAVLFSPAIEEFLRLIFRESLLLFQALAFWKGSEQWFHQDTAYIEVDRPLEFAAAWIALEDARPGCGELAYFEGSHRLPEHLFSGRYKSWDRARDGQEQHDLWARELPDRARRAGFELKRFLPKKGDALIWHADLVHGGAPIEDPASTRRSIVGHYCPASCEPGYGSRKRFAYKKCWYASEHYLRDADPERVARQLLASRGRERSRS